MIQNRLPLTREKWISIGDLGGPPAMNFGARGRCAGAASFDKFASSLLFRRSAVTGVNRCRGGSFAFSARILLNRAKEAQLAHEGVDPAAFPRSRVVRPLAEASQRNKGKPSPRTVCVSSPRSNRVFRDSQDVSGTNRQA